MKELQEALTFITSESRLFNSTETPFKVSITAGDPRFVLLLGDNASGKSLAVRVLSSYLKATFKKATVPISIRERVGNPFNEMGGFAKTMVYGFEHEQSTGATTISAIQGAIPQLGSDPQQYACVSLDEPELGLSERFHAPLAKLIYQGFVEAPEAGFLLTTHSRRLVKTLLDLMPQPPTLLYFTTSEAPLTTGEGTPTSIEAWLQDNTDRSLDDLLTLHDVSHQHWLTVNKVLKK